MRRNNRKSVNLNETQYEILTEYATGKGISNGEAIIEMARDVQILKSHELLTISENAIHLCDNFDALTQSAKLPQWLKDAIAITIRPIIMQAILNKKDIDFAGLRDSWKVPAGMRLITCFDKE